MLRALLTVCCLALTPIAAHAAATTVTTLSITAAGAATSSVAAGTSFTLTATVLAGTTAVHPGTINFCDATAKFCTGTALLGTAQLQASGNAVLSLRLPAGAHVISASFQPTKPYAASVSATSQITVTGPPPTKTTLGFTGVAGNYTLTGTVTGMGPGRPIAGSLNFLDTTNGSASLGTAALSPLATVTALPLTASYSTGTSAGGPQSVVSADFNGDGILDLALSNNAYNSTSLTILLGKGDGTFALKTTVTVGGTDPYLLQPADFNNDGIPDLVTENFQGTSYTVLLGKGDGTFTALASTTAANEVAVSAIGDFNGDGNLDFALGDYGTGSMTIFLGKGDGTFTQQTATIAVGDPIFIMTSGDFNNDGFTDLAVVQSDNNNAIVYLSNGDGTFSTKGTYAVINQPGSIFAADFNGDGIQDLVTTSAATGLLSVLLGKGDGTFAPGPNSPFPYTLGVVALGDFNGDGILDLAATGGQSGPNLQLDLGNGDGTFTVLPTVFKSSTGTVGAYALIAADFNSDGAMDIATADATLVVGSILLNQSTVTATGSLAGVAIPGGGQHAVVASFPGNGTYAASTSASLTLDVPLTATTLTLTPFPDTFIYGRPEVLTAVLTPSTSGSITANGEAVVFFDYGVAVGSGTLTSGVATLSLSTLPIGTHLFTAVFAGDSTFAPSSSAAVSSAVLPPLQPTMISLAATVNGLAVTKVAVGTSVTYTATVKANGVGVHPGQVLFCDASVVACSGSGLLGSASLLANGTGAVTLRFGLGGRSVRAVFTGTSTAASASSTAAGVNVTGLQPTTSVLTSSGTTGAYQLFASVTGTGTPASPTGTVSFFDTSNGNALVGSATLTGGTALRTFLTLASPTTGVGPIAVITADFNGDGLPDAATLNATDNSVSILLGKGDGTFTAKSTIPTGATGAQTILSADFNGDDIPDLAVASSVGATTVLILLGNGDGTFTAAKGLALTSPLALAVADYNRDGILDLAVSVSANSVIVELGNGDGTFHAATVSAATGNLPKALVSGDFNGDGVPDLAVANFTDSTVGLLFGNGDGTFVPGNSTVKTGLQPIALAAQDLNGDGILDLVSANQGSGTLTVMLGSASGTFAVKSSPAPGGAPTALAIVDLNGDNLPDIAVTGTSTATGISLFNGVGDGTFTAQTAVTLTAGTTPAALVAGDFNGDGIADLFAANSGSSNGSALLNILSYTSTANIGTYTTGAFGPTPGSIIITTTGDLIIPGAGIHNIDVSYPGDTTFAASTSAVLPLNGSQVPTALRLYSNVYANGFGQPLTLTASLVPSSADTRATTGEVISFLVDGVSVGTAPLNAGVATLTINSIAVGKHSLTASFAGDVNFAAAVTAPAVPYRVFPAVAPTTTALSVLVNGVSASTIAPGTTVTLMATVTGASKLVYPGTINFCEARAATCTGAAFYGTAQLNASGVAILKRQFGAGGYTILANFMGNTGFATSASVSVTLSASNSTATAISYSGVPGNYNLTATVSSTGTLVSPTGSASFVDTTNANSVFATATLGAGSTTQSFTAGTGLTGLPTPTIFVAGDFNGDGKTDLVYANSGTYNGTSSTLGLLQNNGDGTYTSKLIANYSYNTVTLLVGDFNNDGFLDVAVPGNGNILLYLGKGDGTFTAAPTPTYVSTGGGFTSGAVADFNGDGNLDIVVNGPSNTATQAYVLIGKGDGTFTLAPSPSSIAEFDTNPLVGDFNRDGIPDLFYIETNQARVLLGNGDGTFTTLLSAVTAAANYAPTMADFNNDGLLDIAQSNYLAGTISILLGNGDGTFKNAPVSPQTGQEPVVIVAADFNGDGIPDLATLNNFDATVSILLGKGDGSFGTRTNLTTLADPYDLIVADLNGDGLPDLQVASPYSTLGNIFLNTISHVVSVTTTATSVPGTGIHFVDASYGGDSGNAPSVSTTIPLTAEPVVIPPSQTGTSVSISVNPVTSAFGQPVTLTATLSPASASNNGETVTFYNNSLVIGTGTLSGGIASFTTSSLPLGKSLLSAAYNGDSAFQASISGTYHYVVTQASVSIALTITASGQPVTTVANNTPVKLSATVVSGAAAISPGVVRFCDAAYTTCVGPGLLGIGALTKTGMASVAIRPGIGPHAYYAAFQAQTNFANSTAPNRNLTVTGASASTTTVAATGSKGQYVLTATTTGVGRPLSPTGGVSFYDTTNGNALLSSGTLSAATLSRTFTVGKPILVGNTPGQVVTADFNGDGIPDFVTTNAGTEGPTTLTILLGKPDGTYTSTAVSGFDSTKLSFITGGNTLATADFNGDGIPDLAVGASQSQVFILLGKGDGTFTVSYTLAAGVYNLSLIGNTLITIGDFNNDGILDFLAGASAFNTLGEQIVFAGKGDGTFTVISNAPITTASLNSTTVAGDFNADGKLDFAEIFSTFVQTYLGTGNGGFTQGPSITAGTTPADLQTGDFNGDGILDFAIVNNSSNNVTIALGNGDGTYTNTPTSPSTGIAPYRLTIADFNGDGIDDIAVANQGVSVGNSSVTILYGNGDGTFIRQGADIAVGQKLSSILAVDVNQDGLPDLVLADSAGDSIIVLINTLTETAVAYSGNVQINGAGAHLIDAVYAGDANFSSSTSPALSLNGFAATTTALTLNAGAASGTYGSGIVFTASLSPAGSPATDGEMVTFQSGSTLLGTAALMGGTATLSTTLLPAGTDHVSAVYPGDHTYGTATSNSVTVTVAQAASSIGYVPPATQVYGTSASAAGLLVAIGTPAGGSFAYTASSGATTLPLTAATVLPAGVYSLTATYTPADATDYASSAKTIAGYTVTKAVPTTAWATPAPITYGTQLTGAQLNATSPIAGTFTYQPAAGTVLATGSSTLNATFTPTDTVDYTSATASTTLQVTQTTPAVTWAVPAPLAFGTLLSATQLDATASVPGTFSYSPAAGASLTAGPHMLQVTFTPTDTTDYTVATASVTLLVGQGAPTVTWAVPSPILYGTPLSAAQLNATANVPGTFSYTPALSTVLHAGTQTLNVTFVPSDTTTYTTATASVTLQVTQASPIVSWTSPAAISYGTPLSATQLNATATTGGTFTYTPAAGAVLAAGTQTLKVAFMPTDTTDYTSAASSVVLQVTQATPAITWTTPSPVAVGSSLSSAQLNATANTPGTFVYSPALGTLLSSAGSQTLKVTFTPTDTTDFVAATASVTLQVTQATLSITWSQPAAIVYGTALSAAQLDASATVAGTFTYTPASGTILPAGPQTLKVTFVPTDTVDYAATSTTVSLTVTTAPLKIIPVNASRTFGAANPAFTYTATGFVNGDTSAALTGTPSLTTTATATTAPGAYTIAAAQGTLASANYTPSFLTGTLTIVQAASTSAVTLSAVSVPVGSPATIMVTVASTTTGIPTGSVIFSDGATQLTTVVLTAGQASYTTSALTVGPHTLTVSYGGDGNFTASSGNATLAISAIPADFSLTVGSNATQTVLPGQAAAFSFAVAPSAGGYPGTVNFGVTGLPAGATAVFSPASIAVNGAGQTVTMTVQSTTLAEKLAPLPRPVTPILLAFLLAPIALGRGVRRRLRRNLSRILTVVLALAALATVLGTTGCGSGSGFFSQAPKTYTLTVTGTSGAVQHSGNFTLTIE